ncbi:hypothetical protein [Chondromyces crocatus]|uniref:Uncharacterized protein n=1 Tax=Chondromyces crocatus TaxID=52 RepID=A0A0K1EJS0_CHOCO|nr:hypothetical protein [Chondromyces crocatus]AKT41100.1 uncharacterized protein CMC5_052590 [Chondromyces crocatus]
MNSQDDPEPTLRQRTRARTLAWGTLGGLAVLFTLLPASCRLGRIMIYTCPDPCETCDDPCHPCIEALGECVPEAPFGWAGPVLVWAGPRAIEPPPCPDHAPSRVYQGYDGLSVERGCPRCSCGPITCLSPETIATSDRAVCLGDEPRDDDLHLPIPPLWSGSCLEVPAVDEADVASLSASETRVGACEPNVGPIPASDAFAWDFHAMACANEAAPRLCEDEANWCAPQLTGDFHQCVYTRGDEPTCPVGYPKRRVFFEGIDGSLACTACACDAPAVSECRVNVEAFRDPACNDSIGDVDPDLATRACTDLVLPGGLRSLSMTWTVDEPGACAPRGGSPTGRVTPDGPTTFCCL